MKAQIRILGGVPSGSVFVSSNPEILIGRHPNCDIQFDPEQDLEVSVRHAVIERIGEAWVVRDLGSRNGTLVNGHRITTDTRLGDTDQIRLGGRGPGLEFRLVPDSVVDTKRARAYPARPRRTGAAGAPSEERKRESTSKKVRVRVAQETKKLRRIAALLLTALVIVSAGAWIANSRLREARNRDVAALQARIDSVLSVHVEIVQGLQGELQGLAAALDQSRSDVQSLQTQIARAEQSGNDAEVRNLRRQLQAAVTAFSQQQSAARIDYQRIREMNQFAVALVTVEYVDGQVITGTAFAVRPDATLITNRHVVTGADGQQSVRRIAVQFADSEQSFAASLVAVATNPAIDLAVIRAELTGAVPTVRGLNRRADTIPVGAPVAIIGFPLGTALPMRQGRNTDLASTTLTAGIVSKALPGDLQIHGWGAQGASGSPIFDARGDVVGVLYSVEEGSDNRIVFGVPAGHVAELLDGIPERE